MGLESISLNWPIFGFRLFCSRTPRSSNLNTKDQKGDVTKDQKGAVEDVAIYNAPLWRFIETIQFNVAIKFLTILIR